MIYIRNVYIKSFLFYQLLNIILCALQRVFQESIMVIFFKNEIRLVFNNEN